MAEVNLCEEVLTKYLEQLSGDFESSSADTGCFLVTPFVRPDGEAIELELELVPSGRVRISDMGDTLGYLYVNGLSLSRSLLDNARSISRPFGVSLQRNTLSIDVELAAVGDALHQMIQTALSITNLIHRRRPTNRVIFDSEVESFIIRQGTTYDADYEIAGKKERHQFKFHIDSGRSLLVQPITAATESAAHTWSERWAYRFSDVLSENMIWHPVAILDDRSQRVIWTSHAIAPIEEYAIRWSAKERLADLLAQIA